MLYHLFHYLDQAYDFPGAGMFNYISFRSALAFIIAILTATIIGEKIINFLRRKQIGETVRDLGIEGENQKKGTPTMGGIIIIISILLPTILLADLTNVYVWMMIVTTVLLGLLGFLDDYIKVFKHNKQGLNGKFKIIGQVIVGLMIGLVMWLHPDITIRPNTKSNIIVTQSTQTEQEAKTVTYSPNKIKTASTTIPFFKDNNFVYSWPFSWAGKHKDLLGWLFFVFMCVLIVTAVSNGANLTDGLDGLATGSSAIIGVVLGILAWVSGNISTASYLNIMHIPGVGEMMIFASAFLGATIGFLWYNTNPAMVFMGDTGSLTLGGIIAVFAIIIRKELLIPILCGIFFVESLSVILQTTYFKITKKLTGNGKRIFKMSPLHHHFQKQGNAGIDAIIQKPINKVPEARLVVRFWIIGLILAALTIITLKIR